MKKIFLSGACRYVSQNESDSWRRWFSKHLDEFYEVFNPNDSFSYTKNNPNDEKLVMDYFLYKLKESDIVVVNLNHSAHSVGTGCEVTTAKDLDKYIIGFGDVEVYEYLKSCCNAWFRTKEDAWEFIVNYL